MSFQSLHKFILIGSISLLWGCTSTLTALPDSKFKNITSTQQFIDEVIGFREKEILYSSYAVFSSDLDIIRPASYTYDYCNYLNGTLNIEHQSTDSLIEPNKDYFDKTYKTKGHGYIFDTIEKSFGYFECVYPDGHFNIAINYSGSYPSSYETPSTRKTLVTVRDAKFSVARIHQLRQEKEDKKNQEREQIAQKNWLQREQERKEAVWTPRTTTTAKWNANNYSATATLSNYRVYWKDRSLTLHLKSTNQGNFTFGIKNEITERSAQICDINDISTPNHLVINNQRTIAINSRCLKETNSPKTYLIGTVTSPKDALTLKDILLVANTIDITFNGWKYTFSNESFSQAWELYNILQK